MQGEFVFDDVTAVRDNRDLRPHVSIRNIFNNDFWGTPMTKEQSHKSYRPLTVLSFRVNYAISELNTVSFHLVNVVLHAVVSVVFFKVVKTVVRSTLVAWTAAVLFVVHPVS